MTSLCSGARTRATTGGDDELSQRTVLRELLQFVRSLGSNVQPTVGQNVRSSSCTYSILPADPLGEGVDSCTRRARRRTSAVGHCSRRTRQALSMSSRSSSPRRASTTATRPNRCTDGRSRSSLRATRRTARSYSRTQRPCPRTSRTLCGFSPVCV